jgi:hypothetical protein
MSFGTRCSAYLVNAFAQVTLGAAFVATFNCNALWALFYVMTLSINDPLPYYYSPSPAYLTVNLAHAVHSTRRLHSTPTPTALLPSRAVVQ